MTNTEFDVALINHDCKNYIGVAMSHLELLTFEHNEMVGNENIECALEALDRSLELSNEIAINSNKQIKNNQKIECSKVCLINVDVNRHLEEKTKPIYEQLRKRFHIKINDSYETIGEQKYIAINYRLMMSFRENIITNAINAGASKIDIHHEMKENYGVATYHDNGKGMSQDELDKLPLLLHGDGAMHGLGAMSIFNTAKEIGFYISYSSIPGEGSTVRIIYPYVEV